MLIEATEVLELNYECNTLFFFVLYRKSWVSAFLQFIILPSWKLYHAYTIELQPRHRRKRNWYFNLNHRLLDYIKYNCIRVYSAVKLFWFLYEFRDLKMLTVIETWKATLTVQLVLFRNDIKAVKYVFIGCVPFIIKKCSIKLSVWTNTCFFRFPYVILIPWFDFVKKSCELFNSIVSNSNMATLRNL
jgi:hypothetical protein